MKKLLYLLMLVPFALLSSCDKDEVTPFDMTLTLSGVTQADGNFYAVEGDNVTITGLDVTSPNGKTAISNVMFFIDGVPLFGAPWNTVDPWTFSTENFRPGTHTVDITGYLLQVDQSLKSFAVSYPLVIVGSEDDLPSGAPEFGSYSLTLNFSNSD